MRVLSIDPGYDRVGFAILEQEEKTHKEILLYSDCFTTERSLSFPLRLRAVGKETERLIKKYTPSACAIEKVYFARNQKTALLVSEARGVFLYIAACTNLPLFEYTPLQIKNAVTGDGHSDKQQIISMIPQLLTIDKPIQHDDEYDAIAIGLTCLASERST